MFERNEVNELSPRFHSFLFQQHTTTSVQRHVNRPFIKQSKKIYKYKIKLTIDRLFVMPFVIPIEVNLHYSIK